MQLLTVNFCVIANPFSFNCLPYFNSHGLYKCKQQSLLNGNIHDNFDFFCFLNLSAVRSRYNFQPFWIIKGAEQIAFLLSIATLTPVRVSLTPCSPLQLLLSQGFCKHVSQLLAPSVMAPEFPSAWVQSILMRHHVDCGSHIRDPKKLIPKESRIVWTLME